MPQGFCCSPARWPSGELAPRHAEGTSREGLFVSQSITLPRLPDDLAGNLGGALPIGKRAAQRRHTDTFTCEAPSPPLPRQLDRVLEHLFLARRYRDGGLA